MNGNFDLKAIAFFCAAGFFPDKDTYKADQKYQYPSASGFHKKFADFNNFNWYSAPEKVSLDAATEKFANLLEFIVDREISNKQTILPLSGGLDSRTLAAALKRTGKKVTAYSYSFKNGHNENLYGAQIAENNNFKFHPLVVENGYLWHVIDQLATLNHCYSEFTHPRQMAFIKQYASMGDVFALGHWGDVLFDDMRVDDNLNDDNILSVVIKKITKKGGKELAIQLWKAWGLKGTFEEYFYTRLKELLQTTRIKGSANATIRAFKSKYWATRWTSSNFCIFESARPITVPYFDTEMCSFVCSLPESLLKGRQIQISYLKKYAPELAKITWQAHKPFNLYNYSLDKAPWNLPFRIINKTRRFVNLKTGNPLIQRNWELQFSGESNKLQLKKYLFENNSLKQIIPEEISKTTFDNFYNNNSLQYAHPLSTLLTISMYCKLFR